MQAGDPPNLSERSLSVDSEEACVSYLTWVNVNFGEVYTFYVHKYLCQRLTVEQSANMSIYHIIRSALIVNIGPVL